MSPFVAGELRSAALVAGLLALILAGAELLRRWGRVPPEVSRKTVHLGTGALVCVFPWLFQSVATVAALSAGFLLLMMFLRSRKLLSAVGDVERASVGELLFPVSVGLLFWLAHDRPAFYVAPLLVLVVPDAAAALVGKTYGRVLFEVEQGERKSLEGSLMFFLLTFLAVFLPLLLMTGTAKGPLALEVLQMAFLVACLEAICVNGVDNLVIPLACYYILVQTTRSDLTWISAQLGVQVFLIFVTLLLAWRGRILSFSGFLAAQLYLYGVFAYGDFAWLVPPLAVYAAFALLRHPRGRQLRPHGFKAVTFFWAVASPFALLLLNNYLQVFAAPAAVAAWMAPLPALFAAAHGGGLACVGQIYRPRYARFLPEPLRWALWPLGGALAAAALAALVLRSQSSPVLLGLAALAGAAAPLFQRWISPSRQGSEAAGARRMACSLALSLGLALGLYGALRP
jgi:dolichol kinase